MIALTNYRGQKISELADVEIIVAAPDDRIRPEAASTRIAHLAVIDALCVALAMRNPSAASAALVVDDQTSEELGEA
ncbi:hypothetical protein [Mycobacterium sp. MS1601]|uniref:hypothetical protein n=1 Tax=Mycobacterium sp. MS1601 TaxID=1936029 RepID=UPI0012F9DC89|nr:hypothetical protein [Mycobacterium sp. MS1601]